MIRKHPSVRPNPSILLRNLIRSDLISLPLRLHQLLIRHYPPLHLCPPTRTQLERRSPNLLVPKHTTFPHPIFLPILILVHPFLDPLAWERGIACGIIVQRFSVDASEHEHVESAAGVSSGGGNGDNILEVVVVNHEAMWGAVFLIVALVDSTGTFFAMIEATAVVELRGLDRIGREGGG